MALRDLIFDEKVSEKEKDRFFLNLKRLQFAVDEKGEPIDFVTKFHETEKKLKEIEKKITALENEKIPAIVYKSFLNKTLTKEDLADLDYKTSKMSFWKEKYDHVRKMLGYEENILRYNLKKLNEGGN